MKSINGGKALYPGSALSESHCTAYLDNFQDIYVQPYNSKKNRRELSNDVAEHRAILKHIKIRTSSVVFSRPEQLRTL